MADPAPPPHQTPSRAPSRQSTRVITPVRTDPNFIRPSQDSRKSLSQRPATTDRGSEDESGDEPQSPENNDSPEISKSQQTNPKRPRKSASTNSTASKPKAKRQKRKKKKPLLAATKEKPLILMNSRRWTLSIRRGDDSLSQAFNIRYEGFQPTPGNVDCSILSPLVWIEDFLLEVAFNYVRRGTHLNSRTWVATEAHRLYLNLQAKVVSTLQVGHSIQSVTVLCVVEDVVLDDPLSFDENNHPEQISSGAPCSKTHHILQKVDFIIQRITSSAAKRAEYEHWCKILEPTGRGLIAGYGIRWNIKFESRDWALHSRKEFYFLTKKTEGDISSGCTMISDYQCLMSFINEKLESCTEPEFKNMFNKMLSKTKTYLDEALDCDAIVIATALNPCFRLSIFQAWFPSHYSRAHKLLQDLYNEKKEELTASTQSKGPVPPPEKNKLKEASDLSINSISFQMRWRRLLKMS
ncbi:hypothetical protein KEM48_004402 [Puccinia striiformis f. sp. tritici PST-130]|nr:hypothetical protein KEM48_004402 [Puccinia striiformis f. sp. tritici PST-130]